MGLTVESDMLLATGEGRNGFEGGEVWSCAWLKDINKWTLEYNCVSYTDF